MNTTVSSRDVLKDIAINCDNIDVTKKWYEVLAMSSITLRASFLDAKVHSLFGLW